MWFSRLWSCNITNAGCHYLSKMLKQTLSLKHLDLGLNRIGTKGAKFLCEALKNPKSKLKSLWWVVPFWTVISISKELSSVADPFRSNMGKSWVKWVKFCIPFFSSICVYSWYIEISRTTGRGLILSSHHKRSRVQGQVGRLGSKGLYPLICLSSPKLSVLLNHQAKGCRDTGPALKISLLHTKNINIVPKFKSSVSKLTVTNSSRDSAYFLPHWPYRHVCKVYFCLFVCLLF
jgi:hypothetical protein